MGAIAVVPAGMTALAVLVPDTNVPVWVGSVAVKLLALLGEAMVNTPAPLALPVSASELM
jgi:hypothetical protein